jgi:hypothetical protein
MVQVSEMYGIEFVYTVGRSFTGHTTMFNLLAIAMRENGVIFF